MERKDRAVGMRFLQRGDGLENLRETAGSTADICEDVGGLSNASIPHGRLASPEGPHTNSSRKGHDTYVVSMRFWVSREIRD